MAEKKVDQEAVDLLNLLKTVKVNIFLNFKLSNLLYFLL
jgi:hypothetical protein